MRRLGDWIEAGARPQPHGVLPAGSRAAGLLDMDDAAIDGSYVRAPKGAHTGPSPVDRSRPGSKHYLIVDRNGPPSAARGYDKYRRLLRARGITPRFARKGTAHGSGPGKTRRGVERIFTRLHQFERLRIRYETRADLRLALLRLACGIICSRRLRTSSGNRR